MRFKINIALLICTAFILRILVVNMGFISGFSTEEAIGGNLNSAFKKSANTEVGTHANTKDYIIAEVFEEDSDHENEEDEAKTNSTIVLSVLYSFLQHLDLSPVSDHSFDLIKSELYPKRYLSLSVLRI
jgi:hypothetical protein